ncbi:MAG: hypothetical protein J6Y78_05215 [Paludibacteraceae bacterium]|nr:hypothetical protein [Paludibacteraceae bacterium]
MNASLKFLPETLKQTGTVGQLLQWIQKNPRQCRDTNLANMARTFGMQSGIKTVTSQAQLQKMVNVQMLNKIGSRRRASFFINYFHKDIPGYILDSAPEEEKKRIETLKKGLQPNQYVDEDGCLVTKPVHKLESKPSEVTITKPAENNLPDLKVEKEEVISSSDASEENTTSVPIKVVDTERGLSISITLNLNINK